MPCSILITVVLTPHSLLFPSPAADASPEPRSVAGAHAQTHGRAVTVTNDAANAGADPETNS